MLRLFLLGPRLFGFRPGLSIPLASLLASGQQPLDREMQDEFVYVVEGNGAVKIGISTDPISRLAQLQTGSHLPLKFVYAAVTEGQAFDIEQAAHATLAPRRLSGEWFSAPADIAVAAITSAAYRLGRPLANVPIDRVAEVVWRARNEADDTIQGPNIIDRILGWGNWLIVGIVLWLVWLIVDASFFSARSL